MDRDLENSLKKFPQVWKRVTESKAADASRREDEKDPRRQRANRRRFEGNR